MIYIKRFTRLSVYFSLSICLVMWLSLEFSDPETQPSPFFIMALMIVFVVFVALFAVDRLLLVRHYGYPKSKATAQITMAVLFLAILGSHEWQAWQTALSQGADIAQHQSLNFLLHHADIHVQHAACALIQEEHLHLWNANIINMCAAQFK
jgi:hypothetical protein